MAFAGQHAIAVDHPVCGNREWPVVSAVHRPANHASGQPGAQTRGNGTVSGYSALRYLSGHLIHKLKKGCLTRSRGPHLFDFTKTAAVFCGCRLLHAMISDWRFILSGHLLLIFSDAGEGSV